MRLLSFMPREKIVQRYVPIPYINTCILTPNMSQNVPQGPVLLQEMIILHNYGRIPLFKEMDFY